MDLKEIGTNTRNWVDSAQDRDYWRAHVNATWRQCLVLSLNFHCKENDGSWVVPMHPGLVTSDYGVHEVEGHCLWSPVCSVSPGCTGTTRNP